MEIPKGYYLLQLHPSYLDDNRFTSCSGKYTRDGGLAAINVPMFWHSIEGEYLIYYPNGQLRSKCNWKDGNLEGEYLNYYQLLY